MDTGSLGSAICPVLLVERRGVPPGDRNPCTFRSFMLPMSCSDILEISERPPVVISSAGGWACPVAILCTEEVGEAADVVMPRGWN